MNLGDIRLIAKMQPGLRRFPGTTENQLVDRYANEAVRAVLLDTKCFVDVGEMTLGANEEDYRLDDEILAVVETMGSVQDEVSVVHPREMRRMRRGEALISSSRTWITLMGDNLMSVYPTSTEDRTLRYYFIPKPTEMTDASHDPSVELYGGIPVQYHPAIEFYVLWRAADFADDRSSNQGERYRELYEREVGRIKKALLLKTGHPIPRAVLAISRPWPRDPSVDLRG